MFSSDSGLCPMHYVNHLFKMNVNLLHNCASIIMVLCLMSCDLFRGIVQKHSVQKII